MRTPVVVLYEGWRANAYQFSRGLSCQFAPEVARLSRTGSLRPDCLSLTHSRATSADSCQALQEDCAAFAFSDLFFVSFVCSLTVAGSDLDREVARREVDDMAAEQSKFANVWVGLSARFSCLCCALRPKRSTSQHAQSATPCQPARHSKSEGMGSKSLYK